MKTTGISLVALQLQLVAALLRAPQLRGEIPAPSERPFESVTLQSHGKASPFCSKFVALFAAGFECS
jgi:hypothetical protein